MKKYAKITNQSTKQCEVGIGTNDKYYKSLGMTLQDVEQGKDNNWYLVGYAPKQTEEERLKEEVKTLESQTRYTRVLREIISATNVSQEVKDIAEKIEKVAIKLRR
jgi:type I site-specific restriction-modification system R (restriction) subunit